MSKPKASQYRIVLVGGSLRASSTNMAVLRSAEALAPDGAKCVLYNGLGELPHFNVELDVAPLPEAVARLREQLDRADAVLFSFPEYAGSLPGSFKNLLDWTVGGGMYQMPVGYVNTSPPGSALGAQQAFRAVLGFINAEIIEAACLQIPVRHDAVDAHGQITDPELQARIRSVLTTIVSYLEARPEPELIG
jgi:chromate reductase